MGIAGDVATLFMVWWDRELKNRLRRQNIDIQLYKRYVDDTNLVAKTVPSANEQPNDKLTMETIQKIDASPQINGRDYTDRIMTIGDKKSYFYSLLTTGNEISQIFPPGSWQQTDFLPCFLRRELCTIARFIRLFTANYWEG